MTKMKFTLGCRHYVLCDNHEDHKIKFLGFCSRVDEVSFLLGRDAVSLGIRFQTLR
jgi:hypothetical protein